MLHYGEKLENGAWWSPWNDLKTPQHVYIMPNVMDVSILPDQWRRREHAMTPTNFGISFTTLLLNRLETFLGYKTSIPNLEGKVHIRDRITDVLL